ncbi:polyamine aminopropyltransferase [Patescibacteria group bacterium]|nr:polyamine aminopropyltransferase [Patescibacteria group bacterium]
MKKQKVALVDSVPFDESRVTVAYKVKKVLYSGKSAYQKINVFDLEFYRRALFLDDILQTTQKDEFIYHEMLCQAPLFLHSLPEKVLIIGGADGGALEEVLKHASVQEVWMVEIDRKVVDVSRKYLPSISKNAFQDKRTHLLFEDGKEFVKKHKSFFDVVILDLSDPGGPAEGLISPAFYRNVKQCLRKNGIVSVQSGSLSAQPHLVALIQKRLRSVFRFVEMRCAVVPSYQAGVFTFTLASDFNFSMVSSKTLEKKFKSAKKMDLKYWSPKIAVASAILPRYIKDFLGK